MNAGMLDNIVEAVLYEGYILYPYRASATKNARRFTFGRVYPQAYHQAEQGAETCTLQTQCLMLRHDGPACRLHVNLRFLQPLTREVGELAAPLTELPPDPAVPAYRVLPRLEVAGRLYQTWQEAVERDVGVVLEPPLQSTAAVPITFAASRQMEQIVNESGDIVGVVVRQLEALYGQLSVTLEALDAQVSRVTVTALNLSPWQADWADPAGAALMRTFASTHVILRVEGGEFFSMTDPPVGYEQAVAECQNRGAWPVLVGDPAAAERDTLLASPIILADYPQIAPESAGNLYDSTEIDELLTLRILTLTDAEKDEMRSVDQHARELLERTDALGADHLMRMHGSLREWRKPEDALEKQIFGVSSATLENDTLNGLHIKVGDPVIVRPKARADAYDLILAGKRAMVVALEEDAEGKVHAAVVLDDDPGRDLGIMRQPGHRFFFGLDELEALATDTEVTP